MCVHAFHDIGTFPKFLAFIDLSRRFVSMFHNSSLTFCFYSPAKCNRYLIQTLLQILADPRCITGVNVKYLCKTIIKASQKIEVIVSVSAF